MMQQTKMTKEMKFKMLLEYLEDSRSILEQDKKKLMEKVNLKVKEFSLYLGALCHIFPDYLVCTPTHNNELECRQIQSLSNIDKMIKENLEKLTAEVKLSNDKALRKYRIILEAFHNKKVLDSYDKALQESLGEMSQRNLDKELKKFVEVFDNIKEVKEGKKNTYKLIKPLDIFIESFDHANEIGWFFNMAHESDPEFFAGLEQFTRKDKDLYLFKNTPFEDTSTIESSQNFQRLKRNIEAREYTKIKYLYDTKEYDNLKPIKLVFVDNNWYVALVDTDNILRFGRLSFIERVDYGSKRGHFQPSSIAKQKEFLLQELQNAMTLYGQEKQVAKLKASPAIARYFQKDMKKFLSSQQFIQELEDGSIEFSVEYTQYLEVLPFVQKWLPDLVILEPRELRDVYTMKLTTMLQNMKGIK